MDSRTPHFDRHNRIENLNGRGERRERHIFVWKNAILRLAGPNRVGVGDVVWRRGDVGGAETDTGGKVLGEGLEPCVTLGLGEKVSKEPRRMSNGEGRIMSHLAEDVVQDGIVCIVVSRHCRPVVGHDVAKG
jgi:hypothetical protein